MRVVFIGEPDDGISVSSKHATALSGGGDEVWFDSGAFESPGGARPELIHLVTFEQTDFGLLRRLALARMSGTPVVRFWTGRDVLWAERHAPSRSFALATARFGARQYSRTPALVERLERIGISASVGPVLSSSIHASHEPAPMPAVFTVLCHLPTPRRESAGGAVVDRLIERLGNVRFLILGDTETSYRDRKNVESLGVVEDAARAIQRSVVLVQPRIDGGLSRLALEMLCHGRHVISTHPAPHCIHARSEEEFFAAIRNLERDVGFNLAGREYVCEHYSTPRMTRDLHAVLESCLELGEPDQPTNGRLSGCLSALSQAGLLRAKRFALPSPTEFPPGDPFSALVRDAARAHCSRSAETAGA